MMAFTQTEASRDMVKVEVRYEEQCEGDFELMQMDIPLSDGCGMITPQWIVKCDMKDQGKNQNVFDYLQVLTNQGDVVTSNE